MRKKREKCVKMHIEGISSQFRLVTINCNIVSPIFHRFFFFFNKWYFIIYFSSFFLKLEKKKNTKCFHFLQNTLNIFSPPPLHSEIRISLSRPIFIFQADKITLIEQKSSSLLN